MGMSSRVKNLGCGSDDAYYKVRIVTVLERFKILKISGQEPEKRIIKRLSHQTSSSDEGRHSTIYPSTLIHLTLLSIDYRWLVTPVRGLQLWPSNLDQCG